MSSWAFLHLLMGLSNRKMDWVFALGSTIPSEFSVSSLPQDGKNELWWNVWIQLEDQLSLVHSQIFFLVFETLIFKVFFFYRLLNFFILSFAVQFYISVLVPFWYVFHMVTLTYWEYHTKFMQYFRLLFQKISELNLV